ncbi:MAG: PCMD domain-containing protein [Rikenellaceae bacterium]
MKRLFYILAITVICTDVSLAQIEMFEYGDMDRWIIRKVRESRVIGGEEKSIYELADGRDVNEPNIPYTSYSSPWATSSVYARVSGINKGSVTVFPEPRDGGNCTRLECVVENVRVFGIINISAMATGTIFLGEMVEPITDTKNPQAKLSSGIPFTKRPKALVFDYKVNPAKERIYDSGIGRDLVLEGDNAAEAMVILQRRWEDSAGNIYAERIATGWERFDKVVSEWQNGHRIPIHYGDITKAEYFRGYMGLMVEDPIYSRNSKGNMVHVREVGWADKDATPTHIFARLSSSYGGAYIGAEGAKFWIDNIGLAY